MFCDDGLKTRNDNVYDYENYKAPSTPFQFSVISFKLNVKYI